jgi:hypothetical protein
MMAGSLTDMLLQMPSLLCCRCVFTAAGKGVEAVCPAVSTSLDVLHACMHGALQRSPRTVAGSQ